MLTDPVESSMLPPDSAKAKKETFCGLVDAGIVIVLLPLKLAVTGVPSSVDLASESLKPFAPQ